MNKDLLKIALKYRSSIFIMDSSSTVLEDIDINNYKQSIKETIAYNQILNNLGYTIDSHLLKLVLRYNLNLIDIIFILEEFKGARSYKTFYPNFPEEVYNMSEFELYFNAIIHYLSLGEYYPDIDKKPRQTDIDVLNFKRIGIIDINGMIEILCDLLSTNDSLSDFDKESVKVLIAHFGEIYDINTINIPYKENLCYVVEYTDNLELLKTPTDILRYCTYLSGGDVSLTENTKFKSLSKSLRRRITNRLDKVFNVDDFKRHKNKWIKLTHSLHCGEFLKQSKFSDVLRSFRNNKNVESLSTIINESLKNKDYHSAINSLMKKPGEYVRNIVTLINISDGYNSGKLGIDNLEECISEVSTRVLLQAKGHLQVILKGYDSRLVFPKGSTSKVRRVQFKKFTDWQLQLVQDYLNCINSHLRLRLQGTSEGKKVYIDERLSQYTLPTQQRSVSEGQFSYGRGSKIDLEDKNKNITLRMFCHWIGQDIDLSATLYNDKFEMVTHCSFQQLKIKELEIVHSGDITRAPNGASEFIDITMNKVVKSEVRYITLNINVYSGPTFKEHKECFAGFMLRERPNSNEIYDPKTVKYSMKLDGNSKVAVPFIFDIETKQIIWTDLYFRNGGMHHNTVINNDVNVSDVLRSIVNLTDKTTLKDLFSMYYAPSQLTFDIDNADMLYVTDEYEDDTLDNKNVVRASDVLTINSKYIK